MTSDLTFPHGPHLAASRVKSLPTGAWSPPTYYSPYNPSPNNGLNSRSKVRPSVGGVNFTSSYSSLAQELWLLDGFPTSDLQAQASPAEGQTLPQIHSQRSRAPSSA